MYHEIENDHENSQPIEHEHDFIQLRNDSQKEKLRASPPQNNKQLFYFKIDNCLLIIVPTQKCHKSPFQHSKIIYVFTYGQIIVTIQLHNIYIFFKGSK